VSDALAVINKVIAEHREIRRHVKLAGDAINDIEALFTLQKARSGWFQGSAQEITTKQNQMQQSLNLLEQGLRNHFDFEEKHLPPLFGELLMKALLAEHGDINRQISNAKAMLASTRLAGLGRQEMLQKESEIQQMINTLCQTVEEHASHEETILNMMKRALEGAGPVA